MTYIIIIGIVVLIFGYNALRKKPSPVDLLFGNASEYLGYFNKGFCLAGGFRAVTREQSFRNALIVGNTGSGKTSAILLGSLFTLCRSKSSIIVLDVSGENYKLSSGYLNKYRKRKIYCFDLTEKSDGFNVFSLCKDTADLDKVAHILCKNSNAGSKGDPYWITSAESVISLFMQYLFYHAREEEKNMANVIYLLESYMAEPDKVDKLFIRTNARLLKSYRTLNSIPEKTRLSILSTAITALRLFKSPAVARATSVSTFDIATFRKESCVLYLCIPLNQVDFLAPLTAVLFQMLFQEALSKIPNREKENPLYFLIDEMLTMKLDLGLVYSNCRKYLVGCMSLIQCEKMLGMKYSAAESHAIISNSCSRIYLPGQTLETAKNLQEIIGKCLITDENGKERYSYGMEASQIRTCDKAIALINSTAPIKLTIIPYFKHFIYNARTKVTPYEPEQKIFLKEPELIQID